MVDKRAIPQFILYPPPRDLGTKLVDLSVQFPWPIGTDGAEKLGLSSRSCGRPTSYWAASLKGVMSGPGRPRFRTTNPRGLGDLCRHGRARIPVTRRATSMSASRSKVARAACWGCWGSRPERRAAVELTSPRLQCGCPWHRLPCTLSRGGENRGTASTSAKIPRVREGRRGKLSKRLY